MLNLVTWTQYLSGLLILTLVYYTWIAIRFYPQAFRVLLSGKKNIPFQPSEPATGEQQLPTSQIIPDQPITPTQNSEETFDRIESLIAGLKSQIHRKGAGSMETSLTEKLRKVIRAKRIHKKTGKEGSVMAAISAPCTVKYRATEIHSMNKKK
ncbi:hypothetical protein [Pedobacter sp. V48]|uniref:hypothetical protein n=1 Tax=Pedobacter sp. V48 TaxID=509635 RepID=UPI0003E496B7|nr:hypothetical protein [Pedobacter sp. V48]ETZ24153.1 hypothetical protein N824_16570 [Pedobacter sp. V48]